LPTSKRIEIKQLQSSLETLLGSYVAEIIIKDSFGGFEDAEASVKGDMDGFKETLNHLFGAAGVTVYNSVIKKQWLVTRQNKTSYPSNHRRRPNRTI
jgi:hypothetical protein